MKKVVALIFSIGMLSASCVTGFVPKSSYQKSATDRFGTHYLAKEIFNNLRTPAVINSPTIITSFVDLNELEKTSVFGRLMAEKLLDELSRKGFQVVEVRRAQDLFIKKSVGEMILTREINELASVTKARTVLAGTYVATSEGVIINARLIDIKSPEILSTVSYEVELTEEIENLIRGVSPF
ncbi:MAG: FlgO family outer membrane protein [Nitrospinota bacterium]